MAARAGSLEAAEACWSDDAASQACTGFAGAAASVEQPRGAEAAVEAPRHGLGFSFAGAARGCLLSEAFTAAGSCWLASPILSCAAAIPGSASCAEWLGVSCIYALTRNAVSVRLTHVGKTCYMLLPQLWHYADTNKLARAAEVACYNVGRSMERASCDI